MKEKRIDTTLFDRAAEFAIRAHSGTERRTKGFPYVIHCMETAEIVSRMTNDPEVLAAAMLHDTIEDTDVTAEELEREFGPRVVSLVLAESDPDVSVPAEADEWRIRKKAALERLRSLGRDAKIVTLGDKLSNLRAIARDYEATGDALWERFAVKDPAVHARRYRALRDALSDLADTDAYREFSELVDRTFGPEKP